jgi:hypothetical protein
MTRLWTVFVDAVAQLIPLPLAVIILLAIAGIIGLLWYFFPRWVPRRLPRFRKPTWRLRWPTWRLRWPTWRWRWPDWRSWLRRRKGKKGTETDLEQAIEELAASEEELPDLPPEVFVSLADRLAAQGRYAEAIRERLRAVVRDLVNRGVIAHRPGWTVTELATAASAARPAVGGSLSAATTIFSDIWYGQRPATAAHDERMKALTTQVTDTIADRVRVAA